MKIAIMQPYFLPYIGYFQLINAVDTFVVFDDVNFRKKGWINRNHILINEEPFLFNIPLKNSSQNKLINEIEIVDSDWRSTFLKTIFTGYKKAPFFEVVFPLIEQIVNFEESNLSLFILNSLSKICKFLDVKTEFLLSSSINKDLLMKGESKIIDICSRLKCDLYINAIGGKELYNKDNFNKVNIDLKFIDTINIEYKQFKNNFVPYLSIIDLLMFNSNDKCKELLNNYKLI